jgi:hypothetical protein
MRTSTPRTDRAAMDGWSGDAVAVPLEFARKLERELSKNEVVLEKSEKTGRWIKGRRTGGMCFTISPDRFAEILRTGKLPSAFPNWKLSSTEQIERLVFDENGITVFIK